MKVGILIIGSLLWDIEKKKRINWRQQRLIIADKIKVKVPISYGRLSIRKKDGNKSYTMIFSSGAKSNGELGSAYLVPLKDSNVDIIGIIEEAEWLSFVEGCVDEKNDKSFQMVLGNKYKWAVIGYVLGPNISIKNKEAIKDIWTKKYEKEGANNYFEKHNEFEPPLVKDNGCLDLQLMALNEAEQSLIDDFDLVLTTCTLPTGKLSIEEQVKIAIKDDRKYFINNIKEGVKTFIDDKIIEKM